MRNWDFYRLLHSRRREDGKRMTLARLAREIGSGRSHLVQVINGDRTGGHTWPKLLRALTPLEARMLGRLQQWNEVNEKAEKVST